MENDNFQDDAPQDAVEHEAQTETEAQAPEAVEPSTPVEDAPQFSEEDINEARLFGWKSPDEWVGEIPANYVSDPNAYLERVKKTRIFQAMQERIDRQSAMTDKQLARLHKQHEAELKRLEAQKLAAVEAADTDAYKRISEQEEAIRDEMRDLPTPDKPEAQQDLQAVVRNYAETPDGAWINDPTLRLLGARIINDTPGAKALSPQDQFRLARMQLQAQYPQAFQSQGRPEPRQKPRAVVEGGGLAPSGPARRSKFDSLPPEAKQQFAKFVKQGLFEDNAAGREEYANDY